jgi:HEAT repeat protein
MAERSGRDSGNLNDVFTLLVKRRAITRQRLIGGALLVAALAGFGGLARYGYHRAEDGDILQLIYRTAHGQQPYLDFASGYTPLFFYWHAALLRLFNENLMAIRWALVLANSLTLWGLYTLGRGAMRTVYATLAPLAYAAIIPVVAGEFCAFNVPYPAWYTSLFAVATALAMVRWARHGGPGAAAVAGIAAGLAFSFKPNTGLFALAGAALVMIGLVPAPKAWPARSVWWALLLGLLGGIIGVFGGRTLAYEARVFLWPIFAVLAARVVYRHVAAPHGTRLAAGFVPSCLALALGFAGVSVPWLAYFLARLGWERFVHEVLFIGSGYEQFFYLQFHVFTKWDYGVCLAAVVGVAATWLVRRGRLRPQVPLALAAVSALAGAAYVGLLAPMPEGFQRAVEMRLRDLSFSLSLVALWGGVGLVVRAWRAAAGGRRPLPAADRAVVTILAPALTMFLGLYPRSDFMHLVIAMPIGLVLGALLLSRTSAVWSAALGGRATVRLGFAVPAFVVIAVMATPAARLWLQLRGLGGVRFVSLGLPRAPLVQEEARWRRLAELRAAVEYVEQATLSSAPIFPFPNLNLVCVLAGRENPARQGYFQPGWPGHATEAEVVQALRQRRPPYVVALQSHELIVSAMPGYHFLSAPAYYFLLRGYITAHYSESARIGPYLILRRHDVPAPLVAGVAIERAPLRLDGVEAKPVSERPAVLTSLAAYGVDRVPGAVLAWAATDDPPLQQSLAELVRSSGDSAAAAALVDAVAAPGVRPRVRALFLRIAGEMGDTQALPGLLRLVDAAQTEAVVLDDLQAIANKALIREFWFVPQAGMPTGMREIDSPELRQRVLAWLSDDQESRLRFFAAWAAGVLREPRAVPALIGMLQESDVNGKGVAGWALAAITPSPQTLGLLLDAVADEKAFLPEIISGMYRNAAAVSAPLLRQRMLAAHGERLEWLCWIAGAVGDPALLAGALAAVHDAAPATRLAALWALGELGGAEAQAALTAAQADPDLRVRTFAATARRTLAPPVPLPES